jgi:two-component system, NtrC family, nitrogen regulation response regulator NtrX
MKTPILVADSETIVADDIHCLLSDWGYQPDVVYTGSTMIQAIRDRKPSLVIVDNRLEGRSDGDQMATQIRNHFGVSVVLLVDWLNREREMRLNESDVYCVPKPFDSDALQITVAEALKKTEEKIEI